ncbi:MAG: DUF2780 domain-containing protein [Myxococcota bacterium]
MEFIDELTQQLGIETPKAEALAGGMLGVVRNLVSEKLGQDQAARFESAVPELPAWQSQAEKAMGADAATGADSGLGGLLTSALSSLGGELGGAAGSAALLVPILGKLGIDESHIQMVIPVITRFLNQRLDSDLLGQLAQFLPFLTGASGDGDGLAGVLGGLLS